MYIPPFWCVFICGAVVMIGAFITLLIHAAGKQKTDNPKQ